MTNEGFDSFSVTSCRQNAELEPQYPFNFNLLHHSRQAQYGYRYESCPQFCKKTDFISKSNNHAFLNRITFFFLQFFDDVGGDDDDDAFEDIDSSDGEYIITTYILKTSDLQYNLMFYNLYKLRGNTMDGNQRKNQCSATFTRNIHCIPAIHY